MCVVLLYISRVLQTVDVQVVELRPRVGDESQQGRGEGPNPAATGTVSPLPTEIHTSQRRPKEELNPRGGGVRPPYI